MVKARRVVGGRLQDAIGIKECRSARPREGDARAGAVVQRLLTGKVAAEGRPRDGGGRSADDVLHWREDEHDYLV